MPLDTATATGTHWRVAQSGRKVSFILGDRDADGQTEAQLSFWGEPFMARSTGHDVPRYIFHVQPHSELVARLVELERVYRMSP